MINFNKDIFEPFEKLVEIEIAGETFSVPENNFLLRCFQYLDAENVSMGDFCWNGDCANCQVWLAGAAQEKPVLACRTKVADGMKILRLNREIKLKFDKIRIEK
jgi:NADH dehydrogenase/NADH:ubiquinone oxidoreductase subunit G